jgi:glyoxylase-like metal-dependent hydrolase (beta-lactamase superfamily II)
MYAFGIDQTKIRQLLILHAHFDHVGLVPFFSRRFTELQVMASSRAWEILRMAKGIETINAFSRLVADRMEVSGCLEGRDLEWRDDIVGKTVSEGDRIDLGGMDLLIIETPGHSSCSISAYASAIGALFPSDGGGIPFEEMILPAGNSNYTLYQESLEKLKTLKVELLCADHYGYVAGQEANGYILKSIAAAREKRAVIESVLQRTGSIDATVRELIEELYTSHPGYFLSPEIYAGVYRQTVRHIAAAMEQRR